MSRIRRVVSAGLALGLLAGLAGVGPSARAQAPGVGPFDRQDVFCARHDPPAGRRNSSSPGVTPNAIVLADGSADTAPLRRLGLDLTPFPEVVSAFIAEVNEVCGGVNGRKIVLKKALANALAADSTGHYQSLCLRITEDFKAFMVIGSGVPNHSRCVGILHKTIAVASYTTASADFLASKGRVISSWPPSDIAGRTFISDALKKGTFRGKKLAVLGFNNQPTATEIVRREYIDELKKAGIDAQLEMLPCIGSSACQSQMGASVTRMKNAGVDMIILTNGTPTGQMGTIYKLMAENQLRARVVGPVSPAVHSESVIPTEIRASGRAGAEWMAQQGQTALAMVNRDLTSVWRAGVKPTAFAHMCQQVVARRLKQPAYQLNEREGGKFYAVAESCTSVRALLRGLHSLGANVTTERFTSVIGKVKADRVDNAPVLRDQYWFAGRDLSPAKVTELKFTFPCQGSFTTACMLPVDRPMRVRTPG